VVVADFRSDNLAPVLPVVLRALSDDCAATVRDGGFPGSRFLMLELNEAFARVFEAPVDVTPVVTGTAANGLALAMLVPENGAILCHHRAHIKDWEEGAPGLFSPRSEIVPIEGEDGKISASDLERALKEIRRGTPEKPLALSVTQATERGTVYRQTELRLLTEIARAFGAKVHMDGARFAHATASLGCAPADLSWRCGIDVLSLGMSKLGTMCAEAVIRFGDCAPAGAGVLLKRSGHKLSKRRDLATQLLAMLHEDRWHMVARHTNSLAGILWNGVKGLPGVELVAPLETNQIFLRLTNDVVARLNDKAVPLLCWEKPDVYRFVTAHHHTRADIDALVATIGSAAA
jgi:threonine aldolase